jgi:hypothetical protein
LISSAVGFGIQRTFRHVGGEIRQRFLGPREEARIGAVIALAVVAIADELKSGRAPRSDGFFETQGNRPPAAHELLEGVLLKARDAYEERKLPLLANLYQAFVFDANISPALGNHLLELASRLTYQQIVFMAVTQDEVRRSRLHQSLYDAEGLRGLHSDGIGLLTEIYTMQNLGLVHDLTSGTWIGVGNVNPGGTRLQGSGGILAKAMKLTEAIPSADLDLLVSLLPSA